MKKKNSIGKDEKFFPENEFSDLLDAVLAAKPRSHKKKVPTVLPPTEFGNLMNEIADMERPKPATILYKKLPDDMILITGFENFLSIDDLIDRYGRVIATVYATFSYKMSGEQGAIFLSGMAGFGLIRAWQVYCKQDFSRIIAHVKKCGSLLHDIIRACNEGEVKRVEI